MEQALGEAAVGDPVELSAYTGEGKYQSVLDFTFQESARSYASMSTSAAELANLFATDDMYTDHDSNAYQLPTFVDNHDRGRIGWMIKQGNPGISDSEALRRSQLAHELMYFTRGNPVVYYGDEQGFTGDGNDQDARENMFPSKVASYNDNDLLGTSATTAQSNFDTQHPMCRYIRRLNRSPQTAMVPTYSTDVPFQMVYPAGSESRRANGDGHISVTVPPLSAVVYKAGVALPKAKGGNAAPITLHLAEGGKINGRPFVDASVRDKGFHEVTFAMKVGKSGKWTLIGTDDNPDYKVLFNTKGLADGTEVTFQAVATDSSGRTSVSNKVVQTVDRTAPAPNVFEQP